MRKGLDAKRYGCLSEHGLLNRTPELNSKHIALERSQKKSKDKELSEQLRGFTVTELVLRFKTDSSYGLSFEGFRRFFKLYSIARFLVAPFLAVLLGSWPMPQAKAFTVMDSYQNLQFSRQSLAAEVPIVFDELSAIGLTGRYKYGLSDYTNLFGEAGLLSDDLGYRFRGGFSAYLLPDYRNQPGITLMADLTFLNVGDEGNVLFGVAPVLHKELIGGLWNFEPYISLPLRLRLEDGEYETAANWVFGSGFQAAEWQNIQLHAELGLNASHWIDYFSVGASVSFDTFQQIEIR
jgi:hypothetical protein